MNSITIEWIIKELMHFHNVVIRAPPPPSKAKIGILLHFYNEHSLTAYYPEADEKIF